MFENYVVKQLSKAEINLGISKVFQDSFNAIIDLKNETLKSELACCYHLAVLAKSTDDVKRLGYKNISELASECFGFNGSSVRNYIAVGKVCREVRKGKKVDILSCYALEDGTDFTRNQLNAIMSITEIGYNNSDFNHMTAKQRANYNFKYLIDCGAVKYSDSIDRLKRVRSYLLALGEYNKPIDSEIDVKSFLDFVNSKTKIEAYKFNNESRLLEFQPQSTSEQSTSEQSTSEQSTSEQSTSEQSTSEQSTSEQSTSEQSTSEQSTSEQADYSTYKTDSEISDMLTNLIENARVGRTEEEFASLLENLSEIIKAY